jgi:hypothetical protein
MKKILLAATICFIVNYANGQKPLDKIAFKLSDDFETGELSAWEPFPYNQDEGYDALYYARKTPTHNNSLYAAARPVTAHETSELSHGLTKRLNMWTTPTTRIRAAVFFQSDRNPEKLELSLGTFDGRRYMHIIRNPEANRWLELDIPAGEFKLNGKSLGSGEHIQVVTFKGNYPVVYYLNSYTILLDDFSINGERQRRFEAKSPVSTTFDKFDMSILNKHYFYGDNISLSVVPEGNITLSQVQGTLVDSKGNIIKNNIAFSKRSSDWANDAIYRLSGSEARGQWEIRLTGLTTKGSEVRWGFKFLMPGNQVKGYPRLLFSADELKNRLANEKSPIAKKILERALENTAFMNADIDAIKEPTFGSPDGATGTPYGARPDGGASWDAAQRALGNIIREASFRYAFTGDKKAADVAKKALLKLCSFRQWNTNANVAKKYWTYFPIGDIIKPVAYAYDMLHDYLTADERKFVRDAIMDKALKLFQRDMVENNRMPSNNTNHIAVLVQGYGLAAMAIYGEDPQNPYMEPYLSGIITKTKAFIDNTYYEDGSYNEPKIGYLNMASRAIVELLGPLERNFGVDLSTTTNAQYFYKLPILATASNGLMQDYGDGGGANGESDQLGRLLQTQWFVYRTGNPLLYKYVKPFYDSGNGGYLGYLWYRDDIAPVSRESLPTSGIFKAQGMVMRSGWDDRSTIIHARLGPNANHDHYEQGSFQVMTNGVPLLTDPGRGFGGYYDLDYSVYNIQAIAHNVMLVDHDPESQTPGDFDNGIAALRNWPKMVQAFAGEIADAMEGDLAVLYKDKLETYTRTLLYTKSGPLFLFDKVKSKTGGHTYDWLFHAPLNDDQRSINYSNQRMTVDRPGARLTIDVVSPEIASNRIRDKADDEENFIALSSKPDLKEANFLAVLMPEAKPAAGDYAARPKTTRMDAPGWVGAKVERQGATDLGFFRTGSNAAGTAGGFTTDAKRFTASFDGGGTLVKAYFEGSNFSGSGLSVKSSAPLTCAVSKGSLGTDLEVKSAKAVTLTVNFPSQPSRVILNGKTVTTWKYDAGTKNLNLQIPAGRSDVSAK